MWKKRVGMALWLLAALSLCFFENNTGTKAVLAGSVLLPLISVLAAAWTAKRLTIRLHVPEECPEGQQAEVSCLLSSSWIGAFCGAACRITVRNEMTGVTASHTCTGSTVLPLATEGCGVLSIRAAQAVISDWFGLCSFSARTEAAAEMAVWPALYPVTILLTPPPAAAQEQPQSRGIGTGADETLGVRPYRPGDPVRMIHWKLSGKLDETLVRETGRPQEAEVLLLMENRISEQTAPQDMQACVKALLSTAQSLLAAGMSCHVGSESQRELFLSGLTCADDLLALTCRLLAAPFRLDGESVGTLAAACEWRQAFAHTVLFSPCAETDAASLSGGQRITLVLPQSVGDTLSAGQAAVCCMTEDQAFLEL